jgi:ABC-2 type transport system permease protein
MQKVLDLLRNDLRLFLLDRGNWISLLIFVAMTFVIAYVAGGFGGGPSRVPVDVLDLDRTELSDQFIQAIREANSALALCPADAGEVIDEDQDFCQLDRATAFTREWALARVEDEISLAAVEIPAGFEEDVRAFRPVTVRYWSLEDASAPGYIQEAVDAAIQRVNGAAVASLVGSQVIVSLPGVDLDSSSRDALRRALYDRAATLWAGDPVSVDYQATGEPESSSTLQTLQRGMGQSVPGMGTMFVMLTVFGGMTALILERKQWTLQRLATLPISKAQLLGGKILARFTLGLSQFLILFIVGAVVGMNFGKDPLALVLLIVTYTLAITALSFALGNRLENEAQAGGLGLLLSLTLAPLGGAWWPLEVVPNFMRIAGHISPVAWAMDGFFALIYQEGTLGDVWVSLGVLLAVALVAFWIAIRRFRYD